MARRRLDWFIVALAVGIRLTAVLALRSESLPRTTYEHGEIAANLLAGRGFSVKFLGADGPTSQQAPVYPLIVAGAYALGGAGAPRALLILQLGQAALGGVLALGAVALAREVAPGRTRIALAAGIVTAVHPTLVYATTHVQVAVWAATLLVWVLVLGQRMARSGHDRQAVATGGLLGLLILTDPILGLVAPAVGLATIRGLGRRRAIRALAVLGLVAGITLTPWTLRNYHIHGELVAVKSTFGYAFWQGNCALSEGTDKVVRASVERTLNRGRSLGGALDLRRLNATLWEARHEAGYVDDVALTAEDYRVLAPLSEPERSRRLFQRALADLRAEPGRYLALTLRRLRYFVLFDETNPKTRNPIYRIGHLALTLGAIGGWLAAPAWLRRNLVPTLLTAGLVTAFHALTITSARFHIPLEPLMGLWAACLFSSRELRAPILARRRGRTTGAILATSRSRH
ncbi:MAG: hypothetical protein AB7I30_11130 [Isosphaeraceae bacterium]